MDDQIEANFQLIGSLAIEHAQGFSKNILIYSEIESGASSTDIFYVDNFDIARHKFCSVPLRNQIKLFWEEWRKDTSNQEWRCMSFTIKDGAFSIDLTYPNQIDDTRPASARRPAVVEKHFGNIEVDYENP